MGSQMVFLIIFICGFVAYLVGAIMSSNWTGTIELAGVWMEMVGFVIAIAAILCLLLGGVQ